MLQSFGSPESGYSLALQYIVPRARCKAILGANRGLCASSSSATRILSDFSAFPELGAAGGADTIIAICNHADAIYQCTGAEVLTALRECAIERFNTLSVQSDA